MPQAQTKFITAYGPKIKVRLEFPEPSRTHQSGKDECDINKIMAKYVRTGTLDHQKEHGENYGFATSIDLHTALSTIEQANSMFNDLPSSIRTKMENDPGKFLDFVQDPENQAELVKMGLATEPESQDGNAPSPTQDQPPLGDDVPVTPTEEGTPETKK